GGRCGAPVGAAEGDRGDVDVGRLGEVLDVAAVAADGERGGVEVDRLRALRVGRAGPADVADRAEAARARARRSGDRGHARARGRIVEVGEVGATLVEGLAHAVEARDLLLLAPLRAGQGRRRRA